MMLNLLLLQAVLVTSAWAEKITCFCNIDCDSSGNSCEGDGVCIAYYYQNTTLVQLCRQGALEKLICEANSGIYFAGSGVRGVCCFENNCNSQEKLNNSNATSKPSQNLTTPSIALTTPSEPIRTSESSSTPNSQASSTEQHTSSNSSPPVYAIALSVVLPLIIIAVFAIAIVMFLMYMRLYINHNREKSSSKSEFSQIY